MTIKTPSGLGYFTVLLAVLLCCAHVAGVAAQERLPALDIDVSAETYQMYGIWSDGTTMWVAAWNEKLYAYTLATGARDPAKDFDTLYAAGNRNPEGIWSDGATLWVADYTDRKLYAYTLATGARDPGRDFDDLGGGGWGVSPKGIWSDGTTMWVVDARLGNSKLYAYSLATKARDPGKDFDTFAGRSPTGIWSDGTTMWVAGYSNKKLYAYSLATKARDPGKDFDTLVDGGSPSGIWSDGTTMWGGGFGRGTLYAYTLPRDAGGTAPTFGSAVVRPLTYTVGTSIPPLVLPAATGGTGALAYSLTPALPADLTFTAATRTLAGTPTAAQAATTYTLIATAAGATATLTFQMTVAVGLGPSVPGRTSPLTIDLTCHGYDEGAARGTRAYNCIPVPSQQHHMRTFVPAVGSACDGGSIAEFPAGRIVFQIRCRDGSPGQSVVWRHSGQGPESFMKPIDTPRVWLRTSFSGSSVHLSVWCRAPQGNLVVNELLGTSWGNDGTNGTYGMTGCREVEVDTGAEDMQWWFTEELAATALTPARSWERVTGAGSALGAEALQDLATAAELERLWRQPDRWGMNPRQGANTRGAVLTSDDDGGTRRDLRIASGPDDGPEALDGAPLRGAVRTSPLTIDLTCHGYDEGAARGTRAYNCIPVPSQQRYMRTFVPAVGSACDRGSIAEFPAGRIVFQIRCRDGSAGQSAAWRHSGQGPESFVKPIDTPRVWLRTSFSGSSVHLSVWCRAPQENLVVNELLGTSWGNDGTNGIYGMAGCREVEVDTGGGEDLQWWFTQDPAATALTPPRSWEQATGADRALPAEARQDLATAAELERLWSRPGR